MQDRTRIPVIDLAPWLSGDADARAATAAAVDTALTRAGFLLLTGHGVSREARAAVRGAARRFFALPQEAKQRYAVSVGGRGWLGRGAEANGYSEGTATPPDLKESWTVGADRPSGDPATDAFWFQPNVWPQREVPELREAVEGHLAAMRAVADEVLRLLAAALGQPGDFFTRHTAHPTYTLNINWYPGTAVVGEPQPGQYRIGPHTDFGTVTLLDRQQGKGGLQVYVDPADGGAGWEDAPYDADALTVNIGDLMARWTGDRWRSGRHRVLPPSPEAPAEDLMSLVYFYECDPHTTVTPLPAPLGRVPYEPVDSSVYLKEKLDAITVG
ncbi:isopenicillin N synthase family dioxygenase [Actinacidiphila sp. ITFR-21]|uniref:isopenicillin N synthase family dioxygenase n=1 Tax=Actinacidiphila sp. ITFR-21 TaxID=3075199 RepID=UPI00288C337B|nr:2-oxoglutarate and iron-dependent oxygenase domain-containing protein [Streptomyces sp. ITFR-21]WNI19449.1 2-oxoglutarate and iron-dependent oxygenase domain-containing protein [Streptomyces sp. ITFR-21]